MDAWRYLENGGRHAESGQYDDCKGQREQRSDAGTSARNGRIQWNSFDGYINVGECNCKKDNSNYFWFYNQYISKQNG